MATVKLVSDVWESFYIEGRKLGFMRRETAVSDTPNILTTTLTLMFGSARFQHVCSFYDALGYRPHSYLFDSNDGAPVHVQFVGDEMICQIDEEIFREKVPANTRPSYAYVPLVTTLPFEAGATIPFTRLDDSSCTVQGEAAFTAYGWDEVVIHGERLRLWLVGEVINGRLGNRYWLDETRRIRQSEWQGATSYWLPTQADAFDGLPTSLINDAKKAFAKAPDDDWMADITAWLEGT